MAYITPDSFPVRKKGASPHRREAEAPAEVRSEGFQRDAALFHGVDSRSGTRNETTLEANAARFHGYTPQSTRKQEPSRPADTTDYAQAKEKFYGVTPAETAHSSHSLDRARKQFYGDS